MIPHLSDRERTLAMIVAGALALLALYAMVLKPIAGHLSDLRLEIRVAEAKLLKALKVTNQAAEIDEAYASLSPIHRMSGTDEEIASALLRALESLARGAAIAITDIKPRPGQSGKGYREFLIEMNVEAPMGPLFGFLQDLETNPGMFGVLKINIVPKANTPDALRANLLIRRTVWL